MERIGFFFAHFLATLVVMDTNTKTALFPYVFLFIIYPESKFYLCACGGVVSVVLLSLPGAVANQEDICLLLSSLLLYWWKHTTRAHPLMVSMFGASSFTLQQTNRQNTPGSLFPFLPLQRGYPIYIHTHISTHTLSRF